MATRFEFYLGEEDTERLFAVKEDAGRDNLTGNECRSRKVRMPKGQLSDFWIKYPKYN